MFLTLWTIFLLCAFRLSGANVQIPLDGYDWSLENEGRSLAISEVLVPGGVFTDLMQEGHLDDPYYRDNDALYKWVGRTNWQYSKNFTVDSSLLAYSNIDLACGGLDTVADVYINDILVGKSDNMFVRYIFPVKSALKVGTNSIKVKFFSAVNYASAARVAYPYDVTPDCPTEAQRGECHVNFIRKEQCSFSWDWGPSFPSVGIWRNITLQAFNAVTIRYVTARTDKVASRWTLSGSVFLDVDESYQGTVRLNVSLSNLMATTVRVKITGDKIDYNMSIEDSHITPWMPNEYGEQALYDLMVVMTTDMNDWDQKQLRVGFRTVELVQEPIKGSTGLSFYFRINDVPVFMKGSNWIPADSFQERITTDYLRQLLTSAKLAHMNMLRVWGGGVYESEEFYELADELGIMIWQDFMFACALYPTNTDFLATVSREVTHQIRRLQHHPSIAIWAGNNENEGSIHKADHQHYSDYVRLYIDTIRAVILVEDTSRPFVSSSPSNGVETMKEGWVAQNPQSEYYGDVHHYDYFSDNWNWTIYPRPRFASEFGLQSWCSLEAVKAVAIESDFVWNSDFANHRNHHPDGNNQMYKEWSVHFDQPDRNMTQTEQFDNFIYLTQINQAVGIQTEAELYRRLHGCIMDGRGYTMGSLYWQLNDIWQAPTWASIEYGGKWKMLHYYAQKFYNQTILSPFLENNNLVVHYVDDHMTLPQQDHVTKPAHRVTETANHESEAKEVEEDDVLRFQPFKKRLINRPGKVPKKDRSLEALSLSVQMFSFAQMDYPVKTWSKNFSKPSTPSAVIYEEKLDLLLSQSNCTMDTCFIIVTLDPHNPDVVPSNFVFLSYFKNIQQKGLKAANIEIEGVKQADGAMKTYEVDLKSSAVAPFVWIEARGIKGWFSDNGFLMTGTHTKVMFYAWNEVSVETLRGSLHVRSLMDMYADN